MVLPIHKKPHPHHGGALVSKNNEVWLPYDRDFSKKPYDFFSLLSDFDYKKTLNFDKKPFVLEADSNKNILVINGFGLALGDSIIGLNVVMFLLDSFPGINITLWRSGNCHKYTEEPYDFFKDKVTVEYLPQPSQKMSDFDCVIDISDFMYRQSFDKIPMLDFFYESLGLAVPKDKSYCNNSWLSLVPENVELLSGLPEKYVIFSPQSSSVLRAIPKKYHQKIVSEMIKNTNSEVLGWSNIDVDGYRDITSLSKNFFDFSTLIKNAGLMVSADSSASHIAGGFGIKNIVFFMGINPEMRISHYSNSYGINLDFNNLFFGRHHVGDEEIGLVENAWEGIFSEITKSKIDDFRNNIGKERAVKRIGSL